MAEGPVTLAQLNTTFVKKLFEVDHVSLTSCDGRFLYFIFYFLMNLQILALKFYRHLASKLSCVFYALMGHFLGPSLPAVQPTTMSASSSPPQSPKYFKSVSSANLQIDQLRNRCPNVEDSFFLEVVNRRGKTLSKRKSQSFAKLAYKGISPLFLGLFVSYLQKVADYQTEGNGKRTQHCRLKSNKISIISETFGFKHKVFNYCYVLLPQY